MPPTDPTPTGAPPDATRPSDRWLERAEIVLERCDVLADCSERDGATDRPAFGPAMTRAHALLRGWMEAAGMTVRLDPIGNLRGRISAANEGAPVLYVGSHLDTVVDAGRYDGTLGVLAGVALAEALAEGGPLPYALEVVAFCDEEGVRFGSTYFGSRALAGTFDPALLELEDAGGTTLADALRAFGGDPERIGEAALDPERTLAFVELHIEQGTRLERAGAAVGVVEAIAGQSKLELMLRGRAAHAGTTAMDRRSDALAGAADVVLAAEAMAREEAGAVATVGRIEVRPNVSNVVPAEARFTLDVRHRDDRVRELLVHNMLEATQMAARARDLEVHVRTLLAEPTRPLDAELAARLQLRAGAEPMVSGAGHDAAVIAPHVPTALLFVRSPGGVSHHPDEAVEPDDVASALQTMTGLAFDLAAGAGGLAAPDAPDRPD